VSEPLPTIPGRPLPLTARAPAKCIVFGEHAVVHGAPELLFAADLHTQVLARAAARSSLNGDADAATQHPYFRVALESPWAEGRSIETRVVSRIPRGAGLGSSAALTASLVAVLSAASGGVDRATLAQRSFEVERGAQGVGSPGDTSATVAGGFLSVNAPGSDAPMWTLRNAEQRWEVRRVSDPGWVWVVVHSGIPRATGDAVRAVGVRLQQPDGPQLLGEFARVAREGIRAVANGDRAGAAQLMTENQALLREVGVSHPRLEALIEAAGPAAEAAKLTGAGAGGSVLVLPKAGAETDLVRRLARAGGLPFVVKSATDGAALVEAPA
jgi:mevalonate kinase